MLRRTKKGGPKTVDSNLSIGSDERSLKSSKSTSAVTAALANENKNALWLEKRPVLKAFLNHVIMLLELLPFSDYDAYVRELQATIEDCLGTQRYKRAAQAAHHIQQIRRGAVLAHTSSVENESTSHATVYSSIINIEDRTAAEGSNFFWEDEQLRNDDPQLKALLSELAAQTCHARTILQVEAKFDRLLEGYFTLRVRTHRSTIANVIGTSPMTDPQRCLQFFDLFAINYFNSETFGTYGNIVHPPIANINPHNHHQNRKLNNSLSTGTLGNIQSPGLSPQRQNNSSNQHVHSHTQLHPHLPMHHTPTPSHHASTAFLTGGSSLGASSEQDDTSTVSADTTMSPSYHKRAVTNASPAVSNVLTTTALSPQKKRETRAMLMLGKKAIV